MKKGLARWWLWTLLYRLLDILDTCSLRANIETKLWCIEKDWPDEEGE